MQNQLNNTIQKILKRNITKPEISYNVEKLASGFQASVEIPKMSETFSETVFVGDAKENQQEAKESAASTAINSILSDPDLKAIHDAPKPEKEKPPPSDGPGDKHKLRNAVLKICRTGSMKKEDMVWDTVTHEDGGYISTVTCPCLPGKWGRMKIKGNVCPDENLAEHSAAEVAYEKLMADPEMSSLHDRTGPTKRGGQKRSHEAATGKGKGKGKMGQNPEMMMNQMMMNMMPMMMMMMGGMDSGGSDGPPRKKRKGK